MQDNTALRHTQKKAVWQYCNKHHPFAIINKTQFALKENTCKRIHRENGLLSRQKTSCWTNKLQHWISQSFAGFMVYICFRYEDLSVYYRIKNNSSISFSVSGSDITFTKWKEKLYIRSLNKPDTVQQFLHSSFCRTLTPTFFCLPAYAKQFHDQWSLFFTWKSAGFKIARKWYTAYLIV